MQEGLHSEICISIHNNIAVINKVLLEVMLYAVPMNHIVSCDSLTRLACFGNTLIDECIHIHHQMSEGMLFS